MQRASELAAQVGSDPLPYNLGGAQVERKGGAADGAPALAPAPRFGNSLRVSDAQSEAGGRTQRSSEEEGGSTSRRQQPQLSSEDAIDAEIAAASDAYNSFVG